MSEEGSCPGAQQPELPWIGQLCQGADELRAARTRDYGVVAGELSENGKAETREPHEWMKPQSAKSDFVDETDQVVAPLRMGHFMDENRLELLVSQQTIDTQRQ